MRRGSRRIDRFFGAIALSVAGFAGSGAQAETLIEPAIEVATGYIRNLTLSRREEQEIDSGVMEIAPSINIRHISPRLQAALNYRFQSLFYSDSSDFNSTYHQGGANAQVTAVQDWFYVAGTAIYRQVAKDPDEQINFNNLFITDNFANLYGASLSPILRHDFGRMVFDARYSYGFTKYTNVGSQSAQSFSRGLGFNDTDNYTYAVSLASSDQDQQVTWKLSYTSNETTYSRFPVEVFPPGGGDPIIVYNRPLPYNYENLGLEAGYALRADLRFLATVGVESDLVEDTTTGGLETEYWSAGLRWEPDSRSLVEARFGDRFFGDSYYLRINRKARFLEIDALYTEEPTTVSRRVAFPETVPGEVPGGDPGDDFAGQTSDPFLLTQARLTFTLEGQRTTASLSLFSLERDFLTEKGTDERRGFGVNVSRRLSEATTLNFDASYFDTTQRESEQFKLGRYEASLERKVGRSSEVSLEAGYVNRWESSAYQGSWAGIRYKYTF